ncbi:MAG TPA: NAD(P)H-dependent glycerol-3-phosphate dehydrogenase [Methyloceanibacter sp.]|jgi:glycerol-3-phosphate dehydrogenase (NAD(P)+)|nr:NAD(P)H-dependent glycerol-3-phosphate dehydrogenase [Methyloceanibacter sp.]
MALQSVGIVGAGAWGTALAITSRRAGRDVLIWAYEPETLADINERHRNEVYLPGISIDRAVEATARLNEVANCDLLLLATPAQHMRKIAGELAPYLKERQPLVLCSKGIEQSSGKLLSQVIAEAAPSVEIAVLSGPSFAAEVARGLPAAVTLATAEERLGRALSYALSHSPFRCYWSGDMIGAEIGGAMKNVYAIAAGIVAGKQFGASAHAALVTRSFAEMARFGAALGARRETLAGLSGLGDLVLTCGSAQSRNMSLGIELGKGKRLDAVLGRRQSVTEGVYTASALVEMAVSRGIDMPIAQAVHAVISGLTTVDQAIEALLARPLRAEV